MNRYWGQVIVSAGAVLIAFLLLTFVCLFIWRTCLKKKADYCRLGRYHRWLIACAPLGLIAFNLISRWENDPHTTALWAYAITPAMVALPFVASLIGLVAAEKLYA